MINDYHNPVQTEGIRVEEIDDDEVGVFERGIFTQSDIVAQSNPPKANFQSLYPSRLHSKGHSDTNVI